MGLVKKTPVKMFTFILSNMNERNQEDPMAYAHFESYVPTIGAFVVHEDVRVGKVVVMPDKQTMQIEEVQNALEKFGFKIISSQVDIVIQKSFLGFRWS